MPKRFGKFSRIQKRKIRAGLYRCAKCDREFTCTVGTIFEDSHIPLRKWLVAFYLNSASKKGISSLQLQRVLGLAVIARRYSCNIASATLSAKHHSMKTFRHGRSGRNLCRRKTAGRRARLEKKEKCRLSHAERGGRVRSQVMRHVTGNNLKQVIKDNVRFAPT